VPRSAFGPVLAIGLAGMALGSPLAGYCGDRFGRRAALIGCIAIFGLATIATAFAQGLVGLALLRFVTGMGAGGALPNATALGAEFAEAACGSGETHHRLCSSGRYAGLSHRGAGSARARLAGPRVVEFRANIEF
jgi:MFS family permease